MDISQSKEECFEEFNELDAFVEMQRQHKNNNVFRLDNGRYFNFDVFDFLGGWSIVLRVCLNKMK